MTANLAPTPVAATTSGKPLHDARGFWRLLLAVLAPLPFLAKGIYYLFSPVDGDADFKTTVAAYQAHAQLVTALKYFDVVFLVLLIPATCAVVWIARRGAPRLTTAGAFISLLGFFSGFALLGGVETPALIVTDYHLDPAVIGQVDDALMHDTFFGIASLVFLIGIVAGLGFLGAALWRSRYVAAWAGIAIMVGGITHPFVPGHVAQGIGLLVVTAGYTAVSVALLRMRNDEFDLPPRPAGA
jgi:hypothetical protein